MDNRVEEKLKVIPLSQKYTHELGTVLYDYIVEHKPNLVVELGTGHGFTTLSMGIALCENGKGHLYSYDYYMEDGWQTNIQNIQKKVDEFELQKWISLGKADAYQWIDNPPFEHIDMLYLDIHNHGGVIDYFTNHDYIKKQMNKGMPLFFEGGANPSREQTCRERGQVLFSKMKTKHKLLYDARTGISQVITGE